MAAIAMRWDCSLCTLSNHEDLLYCEVCEQPKIANEIAIVDEIDTDIIDLSSPISKQQSSSSSSLPTSSVVCKHIGVRDETDRPYSLLNMLRRFAVLCVHDRLYLSHPFPEHHTQRGGYGAKWSCGYRNIQTVCSALMTVPEYQTKLYQSAPSIHDIQESIENAWKAGFDPEGAQQLHHKLCGTNKWIGATECAVFFRSRGFRARVVDFVADDTIEDAMEILTAHISTSSSSNAAKDSNDDTESSLLAPYKRVMLSPQNASGKKARTSKTATHAKSPLASVVRRLTRWIYKYFTANTNSNAARTHTDSHTHTHAFRTPLYLQYHGHSVSVVGIVECGDGVDDYCLVTFDPYDSTQSILRTLYETLVQIDNHSQTHTYTYSHPEGKGEDDMMHTHSPPHLVDLSTHIIKPVRKFKGKDYQVVYVESGLMGEVEMRMSRVMDSVRA